MNGTTAYPPLRYGFPAGICLTGMAALIWPGASAGTLCFGWAALYLLLIASYRNASWSCTPGGWLLWGASVALWTGIAVNCHYYITVLGSGDASAPVLMNLDSWSAWNNALFDNGRRDVMPCPWPAQDYGHLVGMLVYVFGDDFSIPLMFNSFCALVTVALTGAIAVRCAGGDLAQRRSMGLTAMVLAASMCYFMVSGTILIKDCPLACAIALTAWASLRMRDRVSVLPILAIIAAAAGIFYLRKNYMLVLAAIVFVMQRQSSRRDLVASCAIALSLFGIWLYMQLANSTVPIGSYISLESSIPDEGDDNSNYGHGAAYTEVLNSYMMLPVWQRVLLVPVVTAIQFLIPLPWSWSKYLIYGPCMALAHFSFCRYAAGALLLYFAGRQFGRGRAPHPLLVLTATGAMLYIASAFTFGGTIARYGIPLVSLMIPAAAYTWLHYRRERAFRIWCAVFAAGIAVALTLAYIATT